MKAKILSRRAGHLGGIGHTFRHGNSEACARPCIRDTRHRPHPRGGNHRLLHNRDGNPNG